jgi:ribose 5-phosphate isomerase B
VRLALGTDEVTELTDFLVGHLGHLGHQVEVVAYPLAWPEAGRAVGRAVAAGRAERGLVCCTTGTGVAMAANKVPGVRAALCTDAATAVGARRWNDANVVAFPLTTPVEVLVAMVEALVTTPLDPEEAEVVARLEPSG